MNEVIEIAKLNDELRSLRARLAAEQRRCGAALVEAGEVRDRCRRLESLLDGARAKATEALARARRAEAALEGVLGSRGCARAARIATSQLAARRKAEGSTPPMLGDCGSARDLGYDAALENLVELLDRVGAERPRVVRRERPEFSLDLEEL